MYREDDENYIPLEKCKDGYLYEIDSRNLSYGVYNSATRSFYGIRYKFGQRFIDDEYHWSLGVPYGTCKPQKELEQCPIPFVGRIVSATSTWAGQILTNQDELFKWLEGRIQY